MVKKLFSLVLLASVLTSSSLVLASAAPVADSAAEVKATAEVKKVCCSNHAQPSVAKRAVAAVASTASSAAQGAKSAANSAVSSVKSAATRTVAASSAIVLAVYNASWVKHKGLTCATLAALAGVLLYNNNETFRAKVRGFFGLDDQSCDYCPSVCSDECGSK